MKADVYSYGILTLEVVSGRNWANANHGGVQKLLAEWVRDSFKTFLHLMNVFFSNMFSYISDHCVVELHESLDFGSFFYFFCLLHVSSFLYELLHFLFQRNAL